MIRRLACALLVSAAVAPGWATPAAELLIDLPPEAEESGQVSDPPGRYGVATGVWNGRDVPFIEMNGTRLRQAYRLPNAPGALADTISALSESLTGAGFEIVLSCIDLTCGGFDFRHRLEVLPLPEMYVDLASFRYLSGARGGRDAPDEALVSILVSASGELVYIQVDLVTPLTAEEVAAAEAPATLPPVPPIPADASDPEQASDAPDLPNAQGADASVPAGVAAAFAASGAFVLEGLSFATGAAALTPEEHPSLALLADYLSEMPEARIVLVGHTDTTGSLQGNITVSRRRAQAVADRLVADYGVARSRLSVQGAGYLAPRADNGTAAGRALNRRVTAVLLSPS